MLPPEFTVKTFTLRLRPETRQCYIYVYTQLCMRSAAEQLPWAKLHVQVFLYRYSLWPCKLPVLTCHVVAHFDLFRKGQLVSKVLFKRVRSVYTPSNVREI